MGYTIKQKIDICLKAESDPFMTQADLAVWAQLQYGDSKPPSQTTISRILSSKNDLIASKETDFQLVRRRKQLNPLLRKILGEWITQACWENIPITTPIIQLTANAIWNRLPNSEKDGNGVFNHKWCNHFMKRLNINLAGNKEDIENDPFNYALNKVWKLDEKLELKIYLKQLIDRENYRPCDIFTIDEFKLFYSLPLDQIFDVSSIDKGLKQSSFSTENSVTIMLGCNLDGLEKLTPLVVGKYDRFDVSQSCESHLKQFASNSVSTETLMNKITEAYQLSYKSNTNKWITSGMFQNYLLALEHKLSSLSPKRKILIILDDSSSHRIINLKFKHIKLCYLKNNNDHRTPYSSASSGSKFDYIPMSFGIIEEFKILYRLQQYLEMINIQKINGQQSNTDNIPFQLSKSNGVNFKDLKSMIDGSSTTNVLSELDYQVPLIKVIEWIKTSWDSISPEKIFSSWKRTHLINLRDPWPTSDPTTTSLAQQSLLPLNVSMSDYNPSKNYQILEEVMKHLSVVIPWEVDDLLGLINERGKITLSYGSIEEIIGSCLLESNNSDVVDKPITNNNPPNPNLSTNANWYEVAKNPLASPSLSGASSSTSTSPRPSALTLGQPQKQQSEQPAQALNLEFYPELNDASVLNPSTMNIDLLLSVAETNRPPPNIPPKLSEPNPFSLESSIPLNDPPALLGVDGGSFNQAQASGQAMLNSNGFYEADGKRQLEDASAGQQFKKQQFSISPHHNLNLSLISTPILNDSLPSTTTASPQFIRGSPVPTKTVFSGINYKSKSSSNLYTKSSMQKPDDSELMLVLEKLLSNVNGHNDTLSLSGSTVDELRLNLQALQRKVAKDAFTN